MEIDNLTILKNQLCDMINSMNAEEIYDFVSFLENHESEEDFELPKGIFCCSNCKIMYGECGEDYLCKERFLYYHKNKQYSYVPISLQEEVVL